MTEDFWHERWRLGQIGFHQNEVHPNVLAFAGGWRGHRVLVPLCGASHDLGWLAHQGADVTGVELSSIAALRVFTDLDVAPVSTVEGPFTVHRAAIGPGHLTLFVGDWFAMTPGAPFDRVWDRAAMIALPPVLRPAYVAQLRRLCGGPFVLLLNTIQYEGVFEGPPFSVPDAEVLTAYKDGGITEVERIDLRDREARWAPLAKAEQVTRRITLA